MAPNLWAGIGLVRGGAGTALVGSHEQVADRIEEYHRLGLDEFIFSGYPHLEEAYWFGEHVTPILRRRGLVEPVADPVATAAGGSARGGRDGRGQAPRQGLTSRAHRDRPAGGPRRASR